MAIAGRSYSAVGVVRRGRKTSQIAAAATRSTTAARTAAALHGKKVQGLSTTTVTILADATVTSGTILADALSETTVTVDAAATTALTGGTATLTTALITAEATLSPVTADTLTTVTITAAGAVSNVATAEATTTATITANGAVTPVIIIEVDGIEGSEAFGSPSVFTKKRLTLNYGVDDHDRPNHRLWMRHRPFTSQLLLACDVTAGTVIVVDSRFSQEALLAEVVVGGGTETIVNDGSPLYSLLLAQGFSWEPYGGNLDPIKEV